MVSSPWTATHSSEMSVNYLPLDMAEHPRRFESLTTQHTETQMS